MTWGGDGTLDVERVNYAESGTAHSVSDPFVLTFLSCVTTVTLTIIRLRSICMASPTKLQLCRSIACQNFQLIELQK